MSLLGQHPLTRGRQQGFSAARTGWSSARTATARSGGRSHAPPDGPLHAQQVARTVHVPHSAACISPHRSPASPPRSTIARSNGDHLTRRLRHADAVVRQQAGQPAGAQFRMPGSSAISRSGNCQF